MLHSVYIHQNFVVEVAYVGSPTTFVTLDNVDYNPGTGLASQVTLTDETGPLADGVAAIRITFNGAAEVHELDVVGEPTVLSEPASWALSGVGLAALGLWHAGRRRRVCLGPAAS